MTARQQHCSACPTLQRGQGGSLQHHITGYLGSAPGGRWAVTIARQVESSMHSPYPRPQQHLFTPTSPHITSTDHNAVSDTRELALPRADRTGGSTLPILRKHVPARPRARATAAATAERRERFRRLPRALLQLYIQNAILPPLLTTLLEEGEEKEETAD